MFDVRNKREETAGAAEVQEERQLEVDLPIDQVAHSVEPCGGWGGGCISEHSSHQLHNDVSSARLLNCKISLFQDSRFKISSIKVQSDCSIVRNVHST